MADLLTKFIDSLSFSEFERLQDLRLQKKQEICSQTARDLLIIFPDQEIRVTDRGTYVTVFFRDSIPKDVLLEFRQLEDLTYFHDLDFSMGVTYDVGVARPYGRIGSMMALSFLCNKRVTNRVDCSFYITRRRERRMRTNHSLKDYLGSDCLGD